MLRDEEKMMAARPERPPNRQSTPLIEHVFTHLVEAIMDGRLAEGERIRDTDIAKELGVSRSPVREALQRLERIGMIEVAPSRYTRVTPVTESSISEALEYAGHQAGVVTRMAVERMSPPDRIIAADLVDALEQALSDPAASAVARTHLYAHMSAQTGNRLQNAMSSELSYAVERNLRRAVLPEEFIDALEANCRAMKEAILNGDVDDAERLAREQHRLLRA